MLQPVGDVLSAANASREGPNRGACKHLVAEENDDVPVCMKIIAAQVLPGSHFMPVSEHVTADWTGGAHAVPSYTRPDHQHMPRLTIVIGSLSQASRWHPPRAQSSSPTTPSCTARSASPTAAQPLSALCMCTLSLNDSRAHRSLYVHPLTE